MTTSTADYLQTRFPDCRGRRRRCVNKEILELSRERQAERRQAHILGRQDKPMSHLMKSYGKGGGQVTGRSHHLGWVDRWVLQNNTAVKDAGSVSRNKSAVGYELILSRGLWETKGKFGSPSKCSLGTQAVPLSVLQTEAEQWQLWVLVERVAGGIDF